MKAWVKTKIIGSGNVRDPRRPDLKGLNLTYSMVDLGTEALCRVSGKSLDITKLLLYSDVRELTDDEALTLIKSVNPNADLRNVDIYDDELDEIAKTLGINPIEVRKSVGSHFHEQEFALIKKIAEKLKVDVSDVESDFKRGKNTAVKEIHRRIKRMLK